MKNNDFKDVVFNRHSVKEFDKDYKIDREEMLQILEEATMAPSSVNLQPWRFVIVESEEGKDKLRPIIKFNTKQNDSSSAMILIFGDMKCYEKTDQIYSQAVEAGYMNEDDKNKSVELFNQVYKSFSKEEMNDVVKIDSSLAAMQLMLVARAHGYDTNPIGGFEKDQLAEAFGLDSDRYVPVMIVAIGKADHAGHKSPRLDVKDITDFK
ncbi:nitroreductase family protein [Anaerococcus sp. Marseille-Q5996]|uniref:nitroreductase family protein n=1 Tax=Anaerococcus sp. Marseille-Q5996 TaxID=2972769 RepID=UPI0021CA5364|nr:nitroreductase family protein [Anaerococcus sp. Marseille-Q5996]